MYPADLSPDEANDLFQDWFCSITNRDGTVSAAQLRNLRLSFNYTPLPVIRQVIEENRD